MIRFINLIKINVFGLQSFERPRWRDLCHVRTFLVALVAAATAGLLAEAVHAMALAELATTAGRYAGWVHLYDFFAGRHWIELPPSSEIPHRHPGLPVAVWALALSYAFLKFPWPKRLTARHFLPGPPDFPNIKLETDTRDDFIWSSRKNHFVGRESDLAALHEFAGGAGGPRLWALCGQSGLGKSYLAAIWLKQLYAKGWDIVWLEQSGDIAKIKDWRPRAHTAIVLDAKVVQEAEWAFLHEIVETTKQSKRRARVLIVGHAPPTLSTALAHLRNALTDAWHKKAEDTDPEAHFLDPVGTSFVHAYRKAISMHELPEGEARLIVAEFDGLTIYVVRKAKDPRSDPRQEIVERAEQALARAEKVKSATGEDADGRALLAISALAGPVSLLRRGEAAWTEPDPEARARLFQWEAPEFRRLPLRLRASDDFEIPAYRPQIEGNEVLLAYLAGLMRSNANDNSIDNRDADAFLERAIAAGSTAVLDRILQLLARHRLVEDAWRANDPAFKSSAREYGSAGARRRSRVAAILALDAFVLRHRREEIIRSLARLGTFFAADENAAFDPMQDRLDNEWLEFSELRNVGIGDREIGLTAAEGAVNAALKWGNLAEAATDVARRDAASARMEAAFVYLRSLADERFPDDREIALVAARGAFNAVLKWGNLAEAATDVALRDAASARMEAAFVYLRSLADERFPDDREIALVAARGAFNAVLKWGNLAEAATDVALRDAASARMEAAFLYLRSLADERFPDDREIVLEAAKGAFNAALKWGNLAEAATDVARRDAASARMEAAFVYLRSLADERFPDDREIALEAAKGAVNAALKWGNLAEAATDVARRDAASARMEAAFVYLRSLADERFPDDREITLVAAEGAVNAVAKWGNLAEYSDGRGAARRGERPDGGGVPLSAQPRR